MKLFLAVGVALLILGNANATTTIYVDTKGSIISDHGAICLPEERLPNGHVRVYTKTPDDLASLDARLAEKGVPAQERAAFILAQASNECARQAGTKCKDGTCTGTKTCKQKFTGGMTSCECQ